MGEGDRDSPITGANTGSIPKPPVQQILLSALFVALVLTQGTVVGSAMARNVASWRVTYPWWEAAVEGPTFPECSRRTGLAPLAASTLATRLEDASSRNWLLQGRTAWLAGRCREAIEAWRMAVTLNPDDPIGWLLCFLGTQGSMRPSPVLAQKIALHLNLQGDQARREGRWEDALEWHLLAFSLLPDTGTASRLEAVYLHQEEKGLAIACWEELAQMLPETDPGHWWALGRAAELREEWEEAVQAYRHGAGLADQPYDYFMRWGVACEHLRDWGQAEEAYRAAVAERPDVFWPYLSIGHVRRSQGDYEGALWWYWRAKRLAPDRMEPEYALGYACYLREDYMAAREHLQRALELRPQHPNSAYYLAQCFYQEGQRESAVQYLRLAIEWHGGQPWSWVSQLGDWLVEMGDLTGALEAYRQALEWHPGDEEIAGRIRELSQP